MSSRYDGKRVYKNGDEMYSEMLRERGLSFFRHYGIAKLRYPTPEEMMELELIGYTWSMEDRFWKVAAKYYGNPSLWYIIAWFNKRPTDHHVKVGDVIYIPMPYDKILRYLGL